MKYRYLLFLFFLFSSTACTANNDWVGEWKFNDKNRYMSFTIQATDKSELEFSYDEGIGINGIRISGQVKIAASNMAFVDSLVRGEKCNLKLQLVKKHKNKTISLSNCELISDDEEPESIKTFVPKQQKLYYKAGFNCIKASTKVEFSICESKILAASDRKLGAIYKSLRKSLSAKNKKRLKHEQRQWIKKRNSSCNKQSKDNIGFCLRRYYGQRLIALNVLRDYKIWYSGKPVYAMFRAIHDMKKDKSFFSVMDKGLGLWLGGIMKRRLTDTGNYEISNIDFINDSYFLLASYRSNPNEGFDPRAFNDKIFIEFSAASGVWVALVADTERLIYIPKNKTILDASKKMNSWMSSFDAPEIINVF